MVTTTKGERVRSECKVRLASGRPILSTCFTPNEQITDSARETIQYLFFCGSRYYIPKDRSLLATSILSYGNVNETLLAHGKKAISQADPTPLIASIHATDPFMYSQEILDSIIIMGFSGVQNMPSVGLIQGKVRQNLEQSGMGFESEVNFIAQAKVRGLFTIGYVFTAEQAILMATIQPDLMVIHLGLTASETNKSTSTENFSALRGLVIEIVQAILRIDRTIPILLHGGPLAETKDVVSLFREVPDLSGYTTTGDFTSQESLLKTLGKLS